MILCNFGHVSSSKVCVCVCFHVFRRCSMICFSDRQCFDLQHIIIFAPAGIGWAMADVCEVLAVARIDPATYGVLSQVDETGRRGDGHLDEMLRTWEVPLSKMSSWDESCQISFIFHVLYNIYTYIMNHYDTYILI